VGFIIEKPNGRGWRESIQEGGEEEEEEEVVVVVEERIRSKI
jgi:hypothetical protein